MGIPLSRRSFCALACASLAAAGCAGSGSTGALWTSRTSDADVRLKQPGKTHLAYARWQEQIGRLAEARQSYERVLGEDPKSLDAMLGLARLDQLSGRTHDAEQGFKNALKHAPDAPQALAALGQFYTSQERWPEAIEALNHATLAAPNDSALRFHLAVALARAGDLDEARLHFTKAVGEAEAHYNIGYILYQKGELAAAQAEFRQALALRPDLRQAQAMLDELSGARRESAAAESSQRGVAERQTARTRPSRSQGSTHGNRPVAQSTAVSPDRQPRPVRQAHAESNVEDYPYRPVPAQSNAETHFGSQAAGRTGSARPAGDFAPRSEQGAGPSAGSSWGTPLEGTPFSQPGPPHGESAAPLSPEQIEQWRNQSAAGP